MAVLWRLRRASVGDVVAAMNRTPGRYLQHGADDAEDPGNKGIRDARQGRARVRLRPVVDERQARRRALRHLVRRLFDGSPSLLVLNVLEDEEIDPAEREQLRETDRACLGASNGR